ncbi:MAG: lipopolysaccharide heptosyltransferase II [Omnitrophica WOR_2 bacterium RBG_13_41_10]|nr:MAG: lipopolysaccharide heptosyltransferase II [Omnitrophica WOR_2 bacterium RBG_13_41_10]
MLKPKINAKRILIFNVNWLGDVLFSTPCIRNIRHNYPDSYIACIIPSRCYLVLKDNPYLDEIIIYDEKDRHKGTLAKFAFVKFLRHKKFDTAFILHRSFTRALICRLARVPKIIGYYTKKRSLFLSEKITPPLKNSCHRIDYYLGIIEKAGLRVEDRALDFFTSEDDKKIIHDFLRQQAIDEKDFLVGINPGGNWLPKRWPREYWAILADRLICDFGAKVIITGSPQDMALVKDIQHLMKEKPIIACNIFNLKQFASLSQKLDLFVTADTGPLHIANAVGSKKIIAIFGPTSCAITGPYPDKNVTIISKDIGCKIPCYVVDCKDNRCMKAVTVDEVLEQVNPVRKDGVF